MSSSASTAVQIHDLKKSYKGGNIQALNGIDLEIEKGEVFGLIGPNGAGKTTLIGCLLGLLQPDEGSISVLGYSPNIMSIRSITGYMPERPDFEHWMTARQFLSYHHGLAQRPARDRETEVTEALEKVEIEKNVWNRRLKTYSRGMLQRLNLAQLLIGKPQVALLDEPTLGLDPLGVAIVRNIVTEMKDKGVTAIINSHQLDEIERVCDRVAFIKKGNIAAMESMHDDNYKKLRNQKYTVRWSEFHSDLTLEETVFEAASLSGCTVFECHRDWAKFVIPSNAKSTQLLKELLDLGVAVIEAVPERSRLEELFSETLTEVA